MNLVFGVESLHVVKDDGAALFAQHYEELTLDRHAVELSPIWAEYAALESINRLLVFTARDGEKMVGYGVFFVTRHMHYADLTVAQNDVFFLQKDYRIGKAGIDFKDYCENAVKESLLGKLKIKWSISPLNDWSSILLRSGYEKEESLYGKLLRE